MSSRRKSKPVRRLDLICSMLQGEQHQTNETNTAPDWTPHEENDTLSPEISGEGPVSSGNVSPHTDETYVHSESVREEDPHTPEFSEETNSVYSMKRNHFITSVDRPPEGVYVLQPEAVSDDEEGRKAFMEKQKIGSECRKRSHDEEDDDFKSNDVNPGLDLSIKKPKLDQDHFPDLNKPCSVPHSKSTSPKFFTNNDDSGSEQMDEKIAKYQHLMELVAQQKPLAQAMDEVGLSVHEFFVLHRINSQLSTSTNENQQLQQYSDNSKVTSAPPTVSTMFDKFSSKDQTSVMSGVNERSKNASKEEHEAKIQALIREANYDVLHQQKTEESQRLADNNRMQHQQSMAADPSVSAALMASLAANNPGQNAEDRQDYVKTLLMKAQNFFSQQARTPIKGEGGMLANNIPSPIHFDGTLQNDSITSGTVSSGVGSIKKGTLDPSNFDEDVFDQYIAKFSSLHRCNSITCPYLTRDHYHCVVEDCNYQRFTNKADVIRHYNMHKKRDNSLAHGFMRFSPTENCSPKFQNCHLNGKSTHYHCMQPDCNKVYTSTSDVMTHENFHKKYMQFVCSGFKRFRATEQCDMLSCSFYNQRTTHFHCTRTDCNFTFKNKCDIEKHKTYHLRDDSYVSKGFKKFYKNESCGSDECVWNYTANHFHCLRVGCNFSFTSTSQIESHKRKHDRNEFTGNGELPETKEPSSSQSASTLSPAIGQMPKLCITTHPCFLTPTFPPVYTTSTPTSLFARPLIRQDPNKVSLFSYRPVPCMDRAGVSSGGHTISPAPSNMSSSSRATANSLHFPHSLISPFSSHITALSSRFLPDNRDLQAYNEQNSPRMSLLNQSLIQEATRKLLASMAPSMVAASLPQGSATSINSLPIAGPLAIAQTIQSSWSGPVSPKVSVDSTRINFANTYTSTTSTDVMPWKPPTLIPDGAKQMTASPASTSMNAASDNFRPSVTQLESQMLKRQREAAVTSWPVSNAIISPIMARNAAAALKPGSSQSSADNGQSEHIFTQTTITAMDEVSKKEIENKKDDELQLVPFHQDVFPALKYFACVQPSKCWITDCDFMDKNHFHCLVENCEAMFCTVENVRKHAKFHQQLESLGATLPIQTISEIKQSSALTIYKADLPKSESASTVIPPPGYIALQSGRPKPPSSAFEKIPTIDPLSSSPFKSQTKAELRSPNAKSESSAFPLNSFSYPGQITPSLTAQLYAASAMLKGAGLPSSSNPDTPISQALMMCSTPNSYGFLENQALSALIGQVGKVVPAVSDPSLSSPAAGVSNEQAPFRPTGKKDPGYIHIKIGMPCLRRDCKYIEQNHWHCTMNRCRYVCKSLGKAQSHRQAHDSLEAYARAAKQCFRSYSVKKKCPNPNCEFKLRGHYHCLKPGCQFSTIGTSKLPWHMKKHEKIARREASGFKYFTKKEQCRQIDCKYNGLFSHYHCIRTGCTFAFQYKHQMSTHVRKHLRRMLGRSYTGDVQDMDHTNVDSGDESLPLIIDEIEEAEQRPGASMNAGEQIKERHEEQQTLTQQQLKVLELMTKQMKSAMNSAEYRMTSCSDSPNVERNSISTSIMPSMENDSNSDGNSSDDCEALDLSSLAAGSSKSNESGGQQHGQDIESLDSLSNGFENNIEHEEGQTETDNDENVQKTELGFKVSSSPSPYFAKFRLNNDTMEGFQRFESSDDCGDEKCSYIFKVSHYHCTRENCSYRFTGRTHMFKHQQHHDRVAGLVRDDFQRFKASHPCDIERCEYRGKSTHFHCLRCNFKCTDSAKVGTHRRQHIKADTLEQSGFQRFRGKDDCEREDCRYRFRNMSHFHCLKPGCRHTVVGLTGIEQHAEKHRRGIQTTQSQADSAKLILQNLSMFQEMQQQVLNVSRSPSSLTASDTVSQYSMNLQAMTAFKDLHNQHDNNPVTPTSPQSASESTHSNQASPFLMTGSQQEPTILSKFSFLSSAGPNQGAIANAASSPVSSTSAAMVTEGVGS